MNEYLDLKKLWLKYIQALDHHDNMKATYIYKDNQTKIHVNIVKDQNELMRDLRIFLTQYSEVNSLWENQSER